MRRRAFVLLLGPGLVGGCGGGYAGYYPLGGRYAPSSLAPGQNGTGGGRGGRAAILLPLSGPRGDIGKAMLNGAELGAGGAAGTLLESKDTGGTPQGAAAAAQAAVAEGAGLILGPLTSAETAAVAPVVREAGVPVLGFTNDPSQAQPGVWTLGITPGQQVRRLVAAAQSQDRTPIAALLPDNDFGHAMGQALIQAAGSSGLPSPEVRYHSQGMASITQAARDISGYASRRGPIDAKIKQARAEGTPEGRREAQELARSAIPPPPFAALLLADTGDALAEIAAVLPYYDVDRSAVQIMGPALWSAPSSGSGQIQGAWYAAPDPALRADFERTYSAKYGAPPPPLADLAYDAASIARVLGASGGFSVASLTQPAGFAGVDGWMMLLADGQVRRGLAVFRIVHGGAEMIEPAPQSATGLGA